MCPLQVSTPMYILKWIFKNYRLTAAGYLCYLRSVHRLIHESHRLPWREELLKMSPQSLSIVVLLAFVCVVMFKAYIIGIVWRCYKYLAMRQHNLRSMLPYIIPDVSTRQVTFIDLKTVLLTYFPNKFRKEITQLCYLIMMRRLRKVLNNNLHHHIKLQWQIQLNYQILLIIPFQMKM